MRKIRCPRCHSTNVQALGNDRKAFSVGKSGIGAILFGWIGLIAGFAGKKGKYEFYCPNCGKRFKHK